jgi:hypothetical protein
MAAKYSKSPMRRPEPTNIQRVHITKKAAIDPKPHQPTAISTDVRQTPTPPITPTSTDPLIESPSNKSLDVIPKYRATAASRAPKSVQTCCPKGNRASLATPRLTSLSFLPKDNLDVLSIQKYNEVQQYSPRLSTMRTLGSYSILGSNNALR